MVHWSVGYEILFSVNSFTEHSDKYSIFSEAFTEMLGSRFYFQWKVHWNIAYRNLISVNIKLNTVFQRSTAFVFAVNEWVAVCPVAGQLADTPTRGLDDSRTGHLADWSTRRLDNSHTGQVADWTTRGCHLRLCMLSFPFFWPFVTPRLAQSTSCLVRELTSPRVGSPRVGESASCSVTVWPGDNRSSHID